MQQDQPKTEFKSPTLWQRAKTAVSGFVKHAIGFFPRGIALTGVIFAASAVLEPLTGLPLLGVTTPDSPVLVGRFLTHLAFGSLISGVIGASSDVYCSCKDPNAASAAATPPTMLSNTTELGKGLAKTVAENGLTAASEHAFTGSGLPPLAVKAASHILGG